MRPLVRGRSGVSSRHPISEAPPLYVRYSEDGRFIRKWSFEPFAGATRYLPSYEPTDETEGCIAWME